MASFLCCSILERMLWAIQIWAREILNIRIFAHRQIEHRTVVASQIHGFIMPRGRCRCLHAQTGIDRTANKFDWHHLPLAAWPSFDLIGTNLDARSFISNDRCGSIRQWVFCHSFSPIVSLSLIVLCLQRILMSVDWHETQSRAKNWFIFLVFF